MEVKHLVLIKDDLGQCYHLNLYILCLRTIISYTVKTVKLKALKKSDVFNSSATATSNFKNSFNLSCKKTLLYIMCMTDMPIHYLLLCAWLICPYITCYYVHDWYAHTLLVIMCMTDMPIHYLLLCAWPICPL